MAICDVCGNDYDKAFSITQAGKTMTFDSFECAIQAMAPRCVHCQCHVIGHGVEAAGRFIVALIVQNNLVSEASATEPRNARRSGWTYIRRELRC
jgi:hypothetical protein